MATSTNARTRSANAAPEEASIRRQPKPSKIKRLVFILLLALIVIATSVGATLYYTWPTDTPLLGLLQKNADPKDAGQALTETTANAQLSGKPIFSKLDPFTVTLNDGTNRSRVLHVAITLRVEDEATNRMLLEYMPMVRDRVLKTLSEQHPTHIQTPEGREQLVTLLTTALRTPYEPNSTSARIANVLFTAFVVQ